MNFEVSNTAEGYVVQAYISDGTGYGQWYPLRNFGQRQGDARAFMLYDCPQLSDAHITALRKSYRPEVKYKRVTSTRFERQI